jgi:hypothetical protein
VVHIWSGHSTLKLKRLVLLGSLINGDGSSREWLHLDCLVQGVDDCSCERYTSAITVYDHDFISKKSSCMLPNISMVRLGQLLFERTIENVVFLQACIVKIVDSLKLNCCRNYCRLSQECAEVIRRGPS